MRLKIDFFPTDYTDISQKIEMTKGIFSYLAAQLLKSRHGRSLARLCLCCLDLYCISSENWLWCAIHCAQFPFCLLCYFYSLQPIKLVPHLELCIGGGIIHYSAWRQQQMITDHKSCTRLPVNNELKNAGLMSTISAKSQFWDLWSYAPQAVEVCRSKYFLL